MASVDSDDAAIYLPDTGEKVRFWTGYSFANEFLTPSDKWNFTTGDAGVIAELRNLLTPGTRMTFLVNDFPQATGFVDALNITSDDNGSKMTVTGRDALSPVVDSGIDPRLSFTESTTLLDLVASVVGPFGFKTISTAPIANRAIVTGFFKPNIRTTSTSFQQPIGEFVVKGGKTSIVTNYKTTSVSSSTDPTKPKYLKDIQLKDFKPKPNEGAWEFLARALKRFKLWAWAGALGDTLYVGEPDFEQASTFSLSRKFGIRAGGAGNNILSATLNIDATDQPSVLIAAGKGGGAAFDKIRLHASMVNEFTGLTATGAIRPDVLAITRQYKGLTTLPVRTKMIPFADTFDTKYPRPVYISDEDSVTQAQLESWLLSEMARHQSRAFSYEVMVKGHTQAGHPWAIDTMVDVQDDVAGVSEPLWVRERVFSKSESGTTTKLTLIKPHTLDLG